MFRTIVAKYDGTCKRCGDRFPAGTKIRFGGKGRTYHFANDCPGKKDAVKVDASNGLVFS